jgi:hypothetical protein
MQLSVSVVAVLPRLTGGIARFLSQQCPPERARAIIRARLARRPQLFLEMVATAIWPFPEHPYRRLLDAAGWSLTTLRESVERRGVDDTLHALLDDGVYLTYDEFKGRRPLIRPGVEIQCSEHEFDNPTITPSYVERTGGSRSRGSAVPASLDFIATQRAPARIAFLDFLGAAQSPTIIWVQRDPGMQWWLSLALLGNPAIRWFSLSALTAGGARQSTTLSLVRALGLLRGHRLPAIEPIPLAAAHEVFEALVKARRAAGRCTVVTTPSAATRLAGLAQARGLTLDRVTFIAQGEPLTPGKYDEIVRSGARVSSRYGFTEAGSVSEGCLNPVAVDDTHLLSDCYGLVQVPRALPNGGKVRALVFTSLLPHSPKVLLNVESDDFAEVSTRRCECPWDELGLHTHLSRIRSFSKLTGEGVTLLGTDCVHVLEEILPREFGGRSTDYQLLEVEDSEHLTRLNLLVSPRVGAIDESRLLARFVEAFKDGPHGRGAAAFWHESGVLRVVRGEPVSTTNGKLFPFHTQALGPRTQPALT